MVMPSEDGHLKLATIATKRKTKPHLVIGPVTTPGNALSRIKAIRG